MHFDFMKNPKKGASRGPFVDLEDEIRKIMNRNNLPQVSESISYSNRELEKWSRTLSTLASRFGRLSRGNQVDVCENAMVEMLQAIDSAEERVWMEVYIFDESPVAARFVKALKDAARRGCEVVLLIDYIGSFNIPNLFLKELEKDGVKVHIFNPFTGRKFAIGSMPFRDHKKMLIVDDCTAFCGSANVSKDCAGIEMGGNARFYDVTVKLSGPAVHDLSEVFCDTLQMIGYGGNMRKPHRCHEPIDDGVLVQILDSNMSRLQRRNGIQSSLATVISHAERDIYLTSSYFYPPGFLKRGLLSAKKRNVGLHMLLSGNSDIPGDINATLHVLRKFFRRKHLSSPQNDFKVFMTTKEHCHAKTIVVDGLWSSVGSFNWDRWSSRRNLEVSVGIFDPVTARRIKQLQIAKEKESMEYTIAHVTSRPRYLQLFDCIVYKLVRLSGRNFFDGLSNGGFKFRFRKAFIRTFIDDNAGELIALSNAPGV